MLFSRCGIFPSIFTQMRFASWDAFMCPKRWPVEETDMLSVVRIRIDCSRTYTQFYVNLSNPKKASMISYKLAEESSDPEFPGEINARWKIEYSERNNFCHPVWLSKLLSVVLWAWNCPRQSVSRAYRECVSWDSRAFQRYDRIRRRDRWVSWQVALLRALSTARWIPWCLRTAC